MQLLASSHEKKISKTESTYANNAQYGIRQNLKALPVMAILCLIHDQLAGSKGVEGLKDDGSGHGADEALPHGLIWEEV